MTNSQFVRFRAAVIAGSRTTNSALPAFSSCASIWPMPAEAADDDMVFRWSICLFIRVQFQKFLQLVECDELHQRAGEEDHAGAAEDDQQIVIVRRGPCRRRGTSSKPTVNTVRTTM